MTHPNRQHRVDPPLSGADSDASLGSWPVLARLPRVGEPALAPVYHHAAEAVSFDDDPYLLEVAELQAADARRSGPYEPQTPESPTTGAKIPYDAELPPAQSHRPAPQWRHRVDPPDHRGQPTSTPAVLRHAPTIHSQPSTLASRIFQWHASMSPNASAIVAAALLFCAVLLCWLTFGRAPSATPPSPTVEDPISRVHAAATPAERDVAPTHAEPVNEDQHDETPVVAAEGASTLDQSSADAPPTIERSAPINDAKETAASPAGGASTHTAGTAPHAGPAQAAAYPGRMESQSAPAAAVAQVETPSPTPMHSPASPPYPVTPYVAFDFSPPTDAAVRTADRSPVEPTSR